MAEDKTRRGRGDKKDKDVSLLAWAVLAEYIRIEREGGLHIKWIENEAGKRVREGGGGFSSLVYGESYSYLQ